MARFKFWAMGLGFALLIASAGCSRGPSISITGSDTMVNLAQAWRERYQNVEPDVSVQVKGGGSGVGIAAMINGKADITTSSRKMKPGELEEAEKRTGKKPKEFVVGLDGLAIYVHPENPIASITIPQLAELYGTGGEIEKWTDLDVENTACPDGEIIRVSRQNSSGTYIYFREAVLGEDREFKQGTTTQSGSSDVVALVSKTPCAIGYSGIGYRTDDVKVVKVAKTEGQSAVEPTRETTIDGSYPISRPLFIYTLGEPEGEVKAFIEWVLSDEGRKVVEESGYFAVPKNNADK
jgi:phosphate transport system substrate-binding protein